MFAGRGCYRFAGGPLSFVVLFGWCCALLVAVSTGRAQGPPGFANQLEWNAKGTIEGASGNTLLIKTEKEEAWAVKLLPGKSKIEVDGTAEQSFLRPGLAVRLSGEIDDKGMLSGEITELTIFTPQGKNSMGIFPAGGLEDAKPVRKLEAGSYEFRGKIASLKDGELVVAAGGKKITGTLASSATITVDASDLTYVQAGDEVAVKGFYTEHGRADAGRGKLGQAMAEEVTVTLAKPLVSAKKTKPGRAAGRLPRGKAPAAQDTAADGEVVNPFGGGDKKAKKAAPEKAGEDEEAIENPFAK